MIVPLPYLLSKAQEGGYALGYFEAWDSYSLEAVIEAAEAENAPVIVGFGCMMVSETWLDSRRNRNTRKYRSDSSRTNTPACCPFTERSTHLSTMHYRHASWFQRGHARYFHMAG